PSGQCATPSASMRRAEAPVTSSPSNRMRPAAGTSRPEIALSVVVLPAPLAPISTTSSARSTVIETSATAATLPYRHCNPSTCSTGAPQIGADDLRVGLDLGGRAVRDDAALVEADHAVGHAHDGAHVVLDQQDRDAVGADFRERSHEARLLGR